MNKGLIWFEIGRVFDIYVFNRAGPNFVFGWYKLRMKHSCDYLSLDGCPG